MTRVRLITAHLKSKLLTFPGARGGSSFQPQNEDQRAFAAGLALFRRAAEAATIRAHLNAVMPAAPNVHTVLLGDLNDGPLAATSQILLGPSDSDVKSGDQADDVRLHNITDVVPLRGAAFQAFLPDTERFSRKHEGRGEMLDQILVDKALVFRNNSFVVDEVRSFVAVTEQTVRASDHAPVLARFDV